MYGSSPESKSSKSVNEMLNNIPSLDSLKNSRIHHRKRNLSAAIVAFLLPHLISYSLEWSAVPHEFGQWQQSEDTWVAPESLGEDQSARIHSWVIGPAKISITMDAGSTDYEAETTLKWGEENSTPLNYPTTTVEIPEGTHSISIITSPNTNDAYSSFTLESIVTEFLVEIEVPSGHLSTPFELEQPNTSIGKFFAWLPEESTITAGVTAENSPIPGHWYRFRDLSWENLLQLDDTLKGSSKYVFSPALETIEMDFSIWTIDSDVPVSQLPYEPNGISFTQSSNAILLTGNIEGPGRLRANGPIGVPFEYSLDDSTFQTLNGQINLLPGENDVAIRIAAPPSSNTSSDPFFLKFNHDFGYKFYIAADYLSSLKSQGGYVIKSESESFLPPGTEVSVSAQPNSNNEFLYWEGSFAGEGPTVERIVQENIIASPIFGVSTSLFGFEWNFKEIHPIFKPKQDPRSNGQLLWFPKTGMVDDQIITAEATFTGAGRLSLPLSFIGPFTNLEVTVDGERIKPIDTPESQYESYWEYFEDVSRYTQIYETELASGGHTVAIRFSFNASYELTPHTSTLPFPIYHLEMGYPILFEALTAEDYSTWLNEYSESTDPLRNKTSPAADLDGDGISNYYEYLFKWNPTEDDQPIKVITNEDGRLYLRTKEIPEKYQNSLRLSGRISSSTNDEGSYLRNPMWVLGEDSIDQQNNDYILREVTDTGEQSQGVEWIWFWYDFLYETPTIE